MVIPSFRNWDQKTNEEKKALLSLPFPRRGYGHIRMITLGKSQSMKRGLVK